MASKRAWPRRCLAPWVLAGAALAGCGSRSALEVAEREPFDAAVPDVQLVDAAIDAAVDAPDARDAQHEPDAPRPLGCPPSGQAVLAKGEGFPTGIAVDRARVYWATAGSACATGRIRAIPKGGGPIVTLADGQTDPHVLVVDDAFAYWYDGCGSGVVRRVPLAGGAVDQVALSIDPAEDARVLAADSRNLYFNGYGVLGVAKQGGAPFVVDEADYVYGLAADDRGVYWAGPVHGGPTMAVFAMPAGATTPVMLVQQDVGVAFAIDTAWVYFDGAGIQRVPRSGGPAQTIVSPPANVGYDMTTDVTSVYWLEGNAELPQYRVHRTPVAGGADAVIAQGSGWAFHVVEDESCVYWTNPGEGTIEAAAK